MKKYSYVAFLVTLFCCSTTRIIAEPVSAAISVGSSIYDFYKKYKEAQNNTDRRSETLYLLRDALNEEIETAYREAVELASMGTLDTEPQVRLAGLHVFEALLKDKSFKLACPAALRAITRTCNSNSSSDYYTKNKDVLYQGISILQEILKKNKNDETLLLAYTLAQAHWNIKEGIINTKDLSDVQEKVFRLLTLLVEYKFEKSYDVALQAAVKKVTISTTPSDAFSLIRQLVEIGYTHDYNAVVKAVNASLARTNSVIQTQARELLQVIEKKTGITHPQVVILSSSSSSSTNVNSESQLIDQLNLLNEGLLNGTFTNYEHAAKIASTHAKTQYTNFRVPRSILTLVAILVQKDAFDYDQALEIAKTYITHTHEEVKKAAENIQAWISSKRSNSPVLIELISWGNKVKDGTISDYNKVCEIAVTHLTHLGVSERATARDILEFLIKKKATIAYEKLAQAACTNFTHINPNRRLEGYILLSTLISKDITNTYAQIIQACVKIIENPDADNKEKEKAQGMLDSISNKFNTSINTNLDSAQYTGIVKMATTYATHALPQVQSWALGVLAYLGKIGVISDYAPITQAAIASTQSSDADTKFNALQLLVLLIDKNAITNYAPVIQAANTHVAAQDQEIKGVAICLFGRLVEKGALTNNAQLVEIINTNIDNTNPFVRTRAIGLLRRLVEKGIVTDHEFAKKVATANSTVSNPEVQKATQELLTAVAKSTTNKQ